MQVTRESKIRMESWQGRDIYSDYGCQKGLFQLKAALLPVGHLGNMRCLACNTQGHLKKDRYSSLWVRRSSHAVTAHF